jgi:hypothetical protein
VKKRNLFFAGVVLLLIVLVGLLPVILSSGGVQDLLISRINTQIPGTLSVGSCSTGWQQGLQCNRLVYDDTKHGVHVSVPRLNSSQGLLALIIAPMNLGTVSVEEPVLVFSGLPPAVKQSPGTAKNNSPPVSSPAATEKSSPAKESAPFWDRMIVKLLVNKAVFKLALSKAPAEILVRNGSLDASLASGSVHFELDLESADGEGTATANGFINLPTRKGALLDTLVTEIKLNVVDMQLEPFLALIPDRENLPRVTAQLSSELLIKAAGINNIRVSGINTLHDVELAGGFLGKDQPRFKQVTLDFDLKRDGENSWQFPGMQLSSDLGILELAGSYEGQGFMARGKGRLELPILFGQFPDLCKVQPDTSLQNGAMDFTINLEKDQQQLDVTTDMVVENLAGMQEGQLFAWNSPVTLHLDGSMTDRDPHIENLALKAPFLNLEGRGDLKDFFLSGSADLGQAVQQLGRIFQLGWDADGMLRLTAESKEDGDNRYVVNTHMDITDFSLSRQGKQVVSKHQLVFSSRLKTPGKLPNTKAEAMDLVFDLSSWPGKMNGKLDSIYHKSGQITARYRLQTDLQLGRLSDLLHNLEILKPETTLAGTMDMAASGYLEEKRVVVRELDSRIDDFILYRQGKIFRDSSVHLFTASPVANDNSVKAVRPLDLADNRTTFFARGGNWNVLDSANHRIVLRNLGLTSDLGSLNVHRLSLEDWQQLPTSLSLKVDGKTDLGKLTPFLQQSGVLAPEGILNGNGSFAVNLAGKAGKEHAGTAQIYINHAILSRGEKTLFADETFHFNTRLQGNLSKRDIDFESFDIQSGFLNLQAKGRLQHSVKEPYFSLNGEITPDFSSLANLLNNLYTIDIRAAGKQKERFSLYYPLNGSVEKKSRKLQFATNLQADYTAFFGIDLRQPVMAVSMEKGVLQAALTGGLNSGGLKLSPRIDYMLTPPVATLPEAEPVLTDVQLGQPMVDGLLKRINPVLGLLTRPTGTISARMDRFSWPLAAHGSQRADLSTVFNVSKITLVPKGALQEILNMAGLGDEPLILDQSEITCTAAGGRISCTPLKMLVAESEMTLAGSVGFDGSLDYLLEVPVTKNLVGKEGYRILQGTTLKVPIRGNSDQTLFDSDALSMAISDLLGQAAGKAAGKVIEQQVDKILPGLLDGLLGN